MLSRRRLTAPLARGVVRGRVPATLLFADPLAVGKWAVAKALAQAVSCLAWRVVLVRDAEALLEPAQSAPLLKALESRSLSE